MKILRKLTLFLFLVAVLLGLSALVPQKANAWKTKTHGYSANILLDDVRDGYIDVEGVNYTVPPEYFLALKDYPDAFRAGTLGPDFYPDMLTGQSYIHPYDADAGIGVGDWLNELVNTVNSLPKNSSARREALAFTLGMAVHYAGDLFGHDFINAFAGGAYPSYAEAAQSTDKLFFIIRHMAEESYMDSLIANRVGNTGVSAPEKFIVNTWIYNGSARNGPASIYSNYTDGMMYQYKYLVELRNKLYKFAEDNRASVTVPIPQIVQFCDRWIEDLDTATYQLIVTFDDIAHDFLTGANGKSDVKIVTDRLNTWLDNYGQYASPAPDIIVDLSRAIGKTQDWILEKIGLSYLKNAFKEFKSKLLENMILWGLSQAGIDYKKYENLLKDPEEALKANGGSVQDYLEFKDYMDDFNNDYRTLDAFYNTVLMGKLILIGPDNLVSFFEEYDIPAFFNHSEGKVMTDEVVIEIHTKDGGLFDTYGTDDNVYLEVYEKGRLVKSKLLDISNYNDFEMNSENGKYPVELGRPVYVGDLSFKLNLKKAFGTGVDEWTPDAAWITCYRAGYEVLAKQKVLTKAHHFEDFNKPLTLDFSAGGNLTYDSVLNLKIISFMLSNDNSTQWVNSSNPLWSNVAARRRILFEVFQGFKPTITLTADKTSVDPGASVTLTAKFQGYWNGITKERRDREYIVTSVNETKLPACSGTAKVYEITNGIKELATGTVNNGVMTVNLQGLTPGVHRLRVDYDGDSYNGSAKSNVLTVSVTRTYRVVFRVENGSWDDGSSGEKSAIVSGSAEGPLYIDMSQVPAVGNKPDSGYKEGSWNPSLSTPVTSDMMEFVYTYQEKQPISSLVTFKVENGCWNNRSNDEILIMLEGLEGDTLTLSADQIPEVGNAPAYPYKAGGWNVTPTAGTPITGNPTFVYSYVMKSAISRSVKFIVENGAWNDGSRDEIELILDGYEDDVLTFEDRQIPQAGLNPDYPYKEGGWDVTPVADTEVTADTVYKYSYVPRTPISVKVTFRVENGCWNSGEREDIVVTLDGYEGDKFTLSGVQIPEAGERPDYPYKEGGWIVAPQTGLPFVSDMTFTYSYTMKDPISRTVTFKVENGEWNGGGKDEMVVKLDGYEGDVLTLKESDIPAAGDNPAYPFKEGGWDNVPEAGVEITGNTTFTYTYIMKDPISFNVIFKVENGSWNNGSKDDVTVTLNGYEDDVLKLIADQIPLAGEKPDHGFKAGEWVVVPDTENPVTVEMVYTYAYEARTVFDVTFETGGGSVIDPAKVFEGDTVEAPADPVRKSFAFAGWFSDEGLATPFDFTVPVASDTVVYAAWENVVYTSDGAKSVTEGVPGDVVITVKRSHADETCFSHFAGVEIDGRELAQGSDYTAAAGSTVVTLKTGVFENLAAGDHTVTVLFDDGEAETTLTVSPKVISPPTGEEFYATALLAVAVLMMLLTLAVTGIKKRENVKG